jgi:hypothetical protein
MKDIRFNISLYVIIPVIFAGIAILSIIITYNTTTHYLSKAMDPLWPVFLWADAADRIHPDQRDPDRKITDRSGQTVCN